jgi:WD40 repeat protein
VRAFWDAELTPDGSRVVAGGASGEVALWDPVSGSQTQEVLPPQRHGIQQLVVSRDGSRVLVTFYLPSGSAEAGSEEDPVAFLAPLSGNGDSVPLRLPVPKDAEGTGRPEYVTAAAFSGDGETVDVGTSAGRIVQFDADSGAERWHIVAHHGSVLELVVDEHTGQLVTSGADSRVVVVDAGEHNVVRNIASSSDLMAAMPTEDGENVALYNSGGGLGTVPLDDEQLMDIVRSKVLRSPTQDECSLYGLGARC